MSLTPAFHAILRADPGLQASVVAVRQPRRQVLDIYAPLGLDDIFTRTLRPNPLWKGPPRREYQTKCERYLQHWPSLRMV